VKTQEDYIKEARERKDKVIRSRAEAAVSRNEHLPIAKFKKEHLDKVEALYIQLKERNNHAKRK